MYVLDLFLGGIYLVFICFFVSFLGNYYDFFGVFLRDVSSILIEVKSRMVLVVGIVRM